MRTAAIKKEELVASTPDYPRVKYAYLHQSLTWPSVGGSEKTLSAQRIPGLEIFWTTEGLLLQCKGQKCFVPAANVINAVFLD